MASLKNAAVLARSFSSSSQNLQLVKPRIAIFGIEGRYANALYSAASKQKKLDAVEKDLLKFQAAVRSDKSLADFIYNPLVNKALKRDAIANGLKKLNYNDVSVNLFGALAENGRMKYLDQVIDAYGRLMSAERGEVLCEVVTAKPLDAAAVKELESALAGFAKTGEKIILTKKVDPGIMGGMIVSVGDRFVDMSIASKIKQYTKVLKDVA
ncbi:ATP synthase subunit O, mitochondrial [Galendromus occidentalis]|uniref:Oligomycin sensitivity conferral protein n=1 Tax=Galendromus occidentalis TaxID=34638 RepID=A0AAJ7L6L5_9ACAR|nr:ATP synthase subunit O, mitochondrial [Galendromus occidentalis]